jgi:HPt (histidine-containing phosphotransfer) domain-containing protein
MEEEIMFNTALLEELGDNQSLLIIMNFFLTSTPKDLKELQEHVAQKNFHEIYKKAHKLKGAVAMLKAQKMVEVLLLLESAAEIDQNMTMIESLVGIFNKMYQVLEKQMLSAIADLKSDLEQNAQKN